VSELSFSEIDLLELLDRLVLHAYYLFGCYPAPRFEPVLRALGDSPEDLAMTTLTRFLDPEDHTVEWRGRDKPTLQSVLNYLKPVLVHDFIDLKRKKLHRKTVDLGRHQEGDEEVEMTFDDFSYSQESPEAQAMKAELNERLLEQFNDEPELKEQLSIQLDPEGYQAYTNIECALLQNIEVSEVENRKKRVMRRLLKIQGQGLGS
jgi:DNA-directed RNA polymerase specialized sigma24 family protein